MIALPAIPRSSARREGRGQGGLHLLAGDGQLGGRRLRQHDRPGQAEPAVGADDVGRLGRRVDPGLERQAARDGRERREVVRPVADDRHPARLQRPRAWPAMSRIDFTPEQTTSGAVGAGELVEVGRDVERAIGPAVDPAQAAGRHDVDAVAAGDPERRPDGRRRVEPPRDRPRQVAPARLEDRARTGPSEPFQLASDPSPTRTDPAEHGDRRRLGAGLADGRLGVAGRLEVVRPGQAVRDQRRLQAPPAPAVRSSSRPPSPTDFGGRPLSEPRPSFVG